MGWDWNVKALAVAIFYFKFNFRLWKSEIEIVDTSQLYNCDKISVPKFIIAVKKKSHFLFRFLLGSAGPSLSWIAPKHFNIMSTFAAASLFLTNIFILTPRLWRLHLISYFENLWNMIICSKFMSHWWNSHEIFFFASIPFPCIEIFDT